MKTEKRMTKQIDQGFAPIVGDKPKVLILGTMPSQKSLEQQQYYGHPQNRFWWIMGQLFGFDATLPYQDRVECVSQYPIVIWDVIASCHRPGSLDSAIDEQTLVPNTIPELLHAYPSIRYIAFNGKAAQRLFRKHLKDALVSMDVIQLALPSTSPAHASMKPEQKLEQWRQIIKAFNE